MECLTRAIGQHRESKEAKKEQESIRKEAIKGILDRQREVFGGDLYVTLRGSFDVMQLGAGVVEGNFRNGLGQDFPLGVITEDEGVFIIKYEKLPEAT